MADSKPNGIPQQKSVKRQVLFGIVITLAVAVSWAGATQFSKSALTDSSFDAPYFLVWFNTCWMILCYPIGLASTLLVNKLQGSNVSILKTFKQNQQIFGEAGFTLKALLTKTLFFTIMWILANYSYSKALTYIAPAETSVIFSTNIAMVYVMSMFILKEQFFLVKLISLFLSTGGVICIGMAAGVGTYSLNGVLLSLFSAFAAGLYKAFFTCLISYGLMLALKVIFKRLIGDTSLGSVSLFMSFLGICNLVLLWPVSIALLETNVETVQWNAVPWEYMIPSALLGLVFNLTLNYGVAVTYPLFISIGLFTGLPINAVIDAVWRNYSFNTMEIIGFVLILLSFVLLLLPDSVIQLDKCIPCLRNRNGYDLPEQEKSYKEQLNETSTNFEDSYERNELSH